MATGLLARWLQTKTFLLIELERLNHKTHYTFNIIYFYFAGGGYSLSKIFLYTRWRYNLSEIPIPYQIDLKEIATIVKPPLMTTFFHSSGGPIIFCLFILMVLLDNMLEKAFYRAKHVLFPKNGVTQVSPSPPPYWPCLHNGHQSKFSIL